MSARRSTPQKKIDERNFPVRVRFSKPENGFGTRINDLHDWLDREVGRGNYAVHGALYRTRDAIAVHLRTTNAASLMVMTFGDFELADWTNEGQQ